MRLATAEDVKNGLFKKNTPYCFMASSQPNTNATALAVNSLKG
jgi:hypothetical protein